MKPKMCYGKMRAVYQNAGQKFDVNWLDAREGKLPTGVKRIRMECPECGRRVWSTITMCDDGCCIYHNLPPHKVKHWWKRKKYKRGDKRKKR